jgi:hypothetical protein
VQGVRRHEVGGERIDERSQGRTGRPDPPR